MGDIVVTTPESAADLAAPMLSSTPRNLAGRGNWLDASHMGIVTACRPIEDGGTAFSSEGSAHAAREGAGAPTERDRAPEPSDLERRKEYELPAFKNKDRMAAA